ncbi:Ankyrin repeats containing protein [Cardinium endosymbiont of Sogatella furcifera]|uniref:ankyrin repeat domain-containing protein n=1 Tax=Cardinium endosymbiont of Sogatella furcifera TaxID=650378 RepID=UPI000E0CF852|nr:ankyrin repeat domain-containing protein [Cardinium endosymbiont of Sogatella furcifera]AXI23982.1 Ankyrin repeats containing protein [Cardinium endosymbiont of Sogatella furcifera]
MLIIWFLLSLLKHTLLSSCVADHLSTKPECSVKEKQTEQKTLEDLVKLVVERICVPHSQNKFFEKDEQGRNPIHHAILNDKPNVLAIILKNSVNNSFITALINAQDNDRNTPLIMATQEGNQDMVKLLLEQPNIDVNKTNREGNTPLMMATQKGKEDIVKMLLKQPNIDVNKKNIEGNTALGMAVKNKKHPAIVQSLLLDNRVNPNLTCSKNAAYSRPCEYLLMWLQINYIRECINREEKEGSIRMLKAFLKRKEINIQSLDFDILKFAQELNDKELLNLINHVLGS